jgi:hypothetical protein
MGYRLALIILAAIAAAALACDVAALRVGRRPLIDRHSCLENPSSYTVALDTSARGDALYRFVYATLFGLGRYAPRPGFPHMDLAPACTLGWREPVAAVKIGPRVLLVRFAGAHVESARFAGAS